MRNGSKTHSFAPDLKTGRQLVDGRCHKGVDFAMLFGVSDVRRCCAQERNKQKTMSAQARNERRNERRTGERGAPVGAARLDRRRVDLGRPGGKVHWHAIVGQQIARDARKAVCQREQKSNARTPMQPPPPPHAPMFSGASQSSAGECTESANVRQKMTPSAAMQR